MKEILITSSVLILALMALRLIFAKRVSRALLYGVWALVALRLLIPVQIGKLDFSVLTAAQPLTETVQEVSEYRVIGQNEREAEIQVAKDYIEQDRTVFTPEVQEYIEKNEAAGNSAEELATALVKTQGSTLYVPEKQAQVARQVEEQTQFVSLGQVAKIVWLCGVGVMALWFAFVNLRQDVLLRKSREKLECDSPIMVYVSAKVGSPCLMGLFRPVIYLTPESAANETIRHHVLTHEQTHYRHGDHIWALVRCVCLCVYWFDPLVWAAALLSRRDCELACDAGAIKRLGEGERLSYGKSLVDVVSHASTPAHLMQTATSMNETKEQLKERVHFIVKKQKFSLICVICMVLVCAIVTGCTATGSTGTGSVTHSTTNSTTATGYETGMVQQPMVFICGGLYYDWAQSRDILPEGAVLLGTVSHTDQWNAPTQEGYAAHLPVDTEIYGIGQTPVYVYIREPQSTKYRTMIRGTQYPVTPEQAGFECVYEIAATTFAPGENFNIRITLKNMGEGIAYIGADTDQFSYATMRLAAEGEDYSFLSENPVVTTDDCTERVLQSGETAAFTYVFKIPVDAPEGLYTVDIGAFHANMRLDLTIAVEKERIAYLSDLPENVQSDIFTAAVEVFRCTENIWAALAPQTHLFGVFGDTYVLYELYEAANDVEYVEEVNGLSFWYPSSTMLCVYTEGAFHSLQEAFDGGILSAEQLQQVYDHYYTVYPYYPH